jgi:hypothetical protein
LVLLAQAATRSVSELSVIPTASNGQPVTISGTMSRFQLRKLRTGNAVYIFDLSDGTETVLVIALGRSGPVTVEGTFEWRLKASFSLKEITTQNVICLPEQVL